MLPAQRGVCLSCFQPAGSFDRCYPCNRAWADNPSLRDVPVLPVSLAVTHHELADALWRYKESEDGKAYATDLTELLDDFGWRHGACLARKAGVAKFDLVTWVPSSKERPGAHPLVEVLRPVRWANPRLAELLRAGGAGEAHKEPRADRFLAHHDARGKRVLVVDDTWTRGTNGLSAAASLLASGAAAVAILVIGRWFVEDRDTETQHYTNFARALGFDAAFCVHCDSRTEAMGLNN